MTYPVPSKEQLKEFYLCGIRTNFPSKRAIPTLEVRDHQLKPYDCEYCGSWHRIPEHNDENGLIDNAKERYIRHLNDTLGSTTKTKTDIPTSAIVVLSVN